MKVGIIGSGGREHAICQSIKKSSKIEKPIEFSKDASTEKITRDLNIWLEKMILKNPGKWIWSHNRWK